MSQIFTIDLPTEVAERAQVVATRTHRRVEEVLLEWLGRAATNIPLEWLPDDEIIAISDLQMAEADQVELHELLAAQREGTLNLTDHARLDALLGLYRAGMIRKSQAMKVAVERGLRPPLSE